MHFDIFYQNTLFLFAFSKNVGSWIQFLLEYQRSYQDHSIKCRYIESVTAGSQ